jgi:radical SAM enzyme (TIGR01210 family)
MHETYDNRAILALRAKKNKLDPFLPYHFLHEREPGLSGGIDTINTLFLTGKECVFKCLMCDLWKNTLDEAPPVGATVQQIDYALERLPRAEVIKLYNNSNFFDPRAIPPESYPAIASRLQDYRRVIVENHPKLCHDGCITFSKQLPGKLEIAMGLETIHPDVLPKLNKQLTPEDFREATIFLRKHAIDVRAFALLNVPYITTREENILWTLNTVKFAFACGAIRCSIIPVRAGNGIMDQLWRENKYTPPSLDVLELVFEKALALRQGQVFVDTWELGSLSGCPHCFATRKDRLEKMNLTQKIYPKISCSCQSHDSL